MTLEELAQDGARRETVPDPDGGARRTLCALDGDERVLVNCSAGKHMSTPAQGKKAVRTLVRGMQERDLSAARSILRVAFGTFLGVPDPNSFAADKEYIATRWKAKPEAALVAEADGAVIGSNFAANWGSFGFFGPLTMHARILESRHRAEPARRHYGSV